MLPVTTYTNTDQTLNENFDDINIADLDLLGLDSALADLNNQPYVNLAIPKQYKYFNPGPHRGDADVMPINIRHKFIVARQAREWPRYFMAFESCGHFLYYYNNLPEDQKTFHEIIPCSRQHLFFDIDADYSCPAVAGLLSKMSIMQAYNIIMNAIIRIFRAVYKCPLTPAGLVVLDASNVSKFSRHIIVGEYWVSGIEQTREFYRRVFNILPAIIQDSGVIDKGVYHAGKSLRICGSHKIEAPHRVLKVLAQEGQTIAPQISQTFISQESVGLSIDLPDIYKKVERNGSAVNVTDADIAKILQQMSSQIASFRVGKIKSGLVQLLRTAPSHCSLCNRIHTSDNAFLTISDKVRFHCHRAGKNSLIIGEGIAQPAVVTKKKKCTRIENMRARIETILKYPTTMGIKADLEYYSHDVQPFSFEECAAILLRSAMGTGKTKMLKKLIEAADYDRIIIVSCRRTLSDELLRKFPTFTDYRDVKGRIEDRFVIVQYESLHRVASVPTINSLLVLDECESVLTQMEYKPRLDNWIAMQYLINNSTNIVAMDAFAGPRSVCLLSRRPTKIIVNTYQQESVTDYVYADKESVLAAMESAAADAKKCPFMVIGNSKKFTRLVRERLAKYNLVVKYYDGDSDKDEKTADCKNVDEAWKDADVVVYTSTISAGCSYEGGRFKKYFAYFTNKSCDYLTCIQMLGRARGIKEFHYAITMQTKNYPTAAADIERFILDSVECPVANTIGDVLWVDGKKEFAYKGDYHHVRIANIGHLHRSANEFFDKFVECRAQMGCKINVVETPSDLAYVASIWQTQRALTRREIQELVEAPIINSARATQLRECEYISAIDQRSLAKFALMKFYGIVNPELIDAAFVGAYNDRRVRSRYVTLNKIFSRQNVAESITAWKESVRAKIGQIDLYNVKSHDIMRVELALGLLLACRFVDVGTWCDFEGKSIEAGVIKGCVGAIKHFVATNKNKIEGCFGSDLRDFEKREFRYILQLINGILESVFGIKLAGVEKNRDKIPARYNIIGPVEFKYIPEKVNKYRPKIDESKNKADVVFGDDEAVHKIYDNSFNDTVAILDQL